MTNNTKVINKLLRKAKLVQLIGELSILADDETNEFDSLLTRIEARLYHYQRTRLGDT